MNKYFRYLLTINLFVILSFISCTKKIPLLELSSSKIDLGTVALNDTIKKAVYIKNIGTDDLKILQLESSCGCTVATLQDSVISPKDSVFFELEIVPDNKDFFERSVVIRSNDAKIFHVLDIEAYVEESS